MKLLKRSLAKLAVTSSIGLLITSSATAQPVPKPVTTPPAAASKTKTPPAKSGQPATTESTAGRRVQFAPHVTIDWSIPHVEIDARVVMREGPIELLVCGVGTKEHESILASPARPQAIRDALGLAGMEPGHPRFFRPSTGDTVPAIGHPLYIQLVYEHEGKSRTIDAHKWLLRRDKKTPVGDLPWMFCGSRMENDRLLADIDGNIASVVDFDSSLIGLSESHTAADSELWLEANTAVIPPRGTAVKILIRALGEGPLVLQLSKRGNFLWNENELSALDLDALIRDRLTRNPNQQVELTPAKDTSNLFARVAARAITGSGIATENMILLLHAEKDDPGLPDAAAKLGRPTKRDPIKVVVPPPGSKKTTTVDLPAGSTPPPSKTDAADPPKPKPPASR